MQDLPIVSFAKTNVINRTVAHTNTLHFKKRLLCCFREILAHYSARCYRQNCAILAVSKVSPFRFKCAAHALLFNEL
jgi:hypothetical protein